MDNVREKFGRVFKTSFYVSRVTFRVDFGRKLNFFTFSSLSAENKFTSGRIFSEKLPKRHSTCSKEIFEGKGVLFEETEIFFQFRTSSEKIWSFGGKISAGLSKLISTQWGNVLKNNFNSDKTNLLSFQEFQQKVLGF